MVDTLPKQLLALVFGWLDPLDLFLVAGVCRTWRKESLSDALWEPPWKGRPVVGSFVGSRILAVWDPNASLRWKYCVLFFCKAVTPPLDTAAWWRSRDILPTPWTYLKVNLLGQWTCGKTSLALTLCGYPAKSMGYIPVQFDSPAHIWAKGALMNIQDNRCGGWDDRVTPLGFPETSVFLLCFSLIERATSDKWLTFYAQEASRYAAKVPRILVGLKSDRGDMRQVTHAEGAVLATKLDCTAYCEVSSWTQQGVPELLDQIARIGSTTNSHRMEKDARCCIN